MNRNFIPLKRVERKQCSSYGLLNGRRPHSEEEMEPASLWIDNQAAMRVLHQDVFCGRTKHIEVRFHWVKIEVQKGRITLAFVKSENNIADALT